MAGGSPSGSVKTNCAPLGRPGACSTQMRPWWAVTMASHTARPRPTPGVADSRSPRVNFWKIRRSAPAVRRGHCRRPRCAVPCPARSRPAGWRCQPACTWPRFPAGCRARARSARRRIPPAAAGTGWTPSPGARPVVRAWPPAPRPPVPLPTAIPAAAACRRFAAGPCPAGWPPAHACAGPGRASRGWCPAHRPAARVAGVPACRSCRPGWSAACAGRATPRQAASCAASRIPC